MSGAINYIMSRVCGRGSFDIPRQILEEAFKDDWLDRNMPRSLEDRVFEAIIRPRVLRDIDMYYGEQILINLQGAEQLSIGDYARVFRINADQTGNREIISAECVGLVPYGANAQFRGTNSMSMVPTAGNDLMNYGSQVMSSMSSIPRVSSTRVDIVGFNTIRVTDNQRFQSMYTLRAFVTNDNRLANIPAQAYDKLLALCVLAVKAYIYNEYIVAMGDNFLRRGQELGIFKQIIEQWSECSKEYYAYKEEQWAVQGIIMNEDQHHGHLQMLMSLGM